MSVVVANRLAREGLRHGGEILVSSGELPLVVAPNEVDRHILVKELRHLGEVGGVEAAEVGVLQLFDRLDVHESLNVASQALDAPLGGNERSSR